jgi:hypothetical protein
MTRLVCGRVSLIGGLAFDRLFILCWRIFGFGVRACRLICSSFFRVLGFFGLLWGIGRCLLFCATFRGNRLFLLAL